MRAGCPDICMLCIEEQKNQKIPIQRRKAQKLPCPIHGDPDIWPENRIAISLYQKLQPYHKIIEQGEKKPLLFLNLELLKIFCDELNLNFLDMLEKLEIVHKQIDGSNQ